MVSMALNNFFDDYGLFLVFHANRSLAVSGLLIFLEIGFQLAKAGAVIGRHGLTPKLNTYLRAIAIYIGHQAYLYHLVEGRFFCIACFQMIGHGAQKSISEQDTQEGTNQSRGYMVTNFFCRPTQ